MSLRQTDTRPQKVCSCLPPPFMISTSSPPLCLPLKSPCKPTLHFRSKQITAPPRNMSVNVFLTRLEESGAAPREFPVFFFFFFVEMSQHYQLMCLRAPRTTYSESSGELKRAWRVSELGRGWHVRSSRWQRKNARACFARKGGEVCH